MNDKYEEWLIHRINMLRELIYCDRGDLFYGNSAIEQAFIRYETYIECLEKYKEEKGE